MIVELHIQQLQSLTVKIINTVSVSAGQAIAVYDITLTRPSFFPSTPIHFLCCFLTRVATETTSGFDCYLDSCFDLFNSVC